MKELLRKHVGAVADRQGYVSWPHQNLIDGVRLDHFESDLRRGDGNELRMKFCAVHSSAALAVNCFAPFKDRPGDLEILGRRGVVAVEFEKRMKIFSDRRPSNLDVWIALEGGAIAVESKFLEYFQPKAAEFAPAYEQLAPPGSERQWWAAYLAAKTTTLPAHLDRAQLIKHYFGLRLLQQASTAPPQLTLLYLFWEPLNWQEVAECCAHRAEVKAFAEQVAGASIRFEWMTYSDLWAGWGEAASIEEHASRLRARYELGV